MAKKPEKPKSLKREDTGPYILLEDLQEQTLFKLFDLYADTLGAPNSPDRQVVLDFIKNRMRDILQKSTDKDFKKFLKVLADKDEGYQSYKLEMLDPAVEGLTTMAGICLQLGFPRQAIDLFKVADHAAPPGSRGDIRAFRNFFNHLPGLAQSTSSHKDLYSHTMHIFEQYVGRKQSGNFDAMTAIIGLRSELRAIGRAKGNHDFSRLNELIGELLTNKKFTREAMEAIPLSDSTEEKISHFSEYRRIPFVAQKIRKGELPGSQTSASTALGEKHNPTAVEDLKIIVEGGRDGPEDLKIEEQEGLK